MKPKFQFNRIDSQGLDKPINVAEFMNDLKEVFIKHNVIAMRDGFVGLDEEGLFNVTNCHIRATSKGITFDEN